ncbi:hypothetical protein DFH06DRAFT_1139997 [Mycena polygramma]|nr:hypothetical protein DFH06DRAFT_1139997 [Mycena polygramma]
MVKRTLNLRAARGSRFQEVKLRMNQRCWEPVKFLFREGLRARAKVNRSRQYHGKKMSKDQSHQTSRRPQESTIREGKRSSLRAGSRRSRSGSVTYTMSASCANCGHRSVSSISPSHETSDLDYLPTSSLLRTELAEVNFAIFRHKAFLDGLEKKRRDLEAGLSQVVYPVLTLPPEILSAIFVECLPTQERRALPSPVTPPLSLAQVCRHWRSIALSTCELWSTVDLFFPFLEDDEEAPLYDNTLALLETWFARAKGRLLSVKIRSPSTRVPEAVLSIVSTASGRLHTLDLDLHPDDFRFLGGNCSAFPSLKRLSVSSPWVYDALSIFGNTPFLSELRADHILELDEISLDDLVDIVTHCPSLSHLKVFVTGHDNGPKTAISAAHLRSLSLHGYGLDFLTLPGLRRLEIRDGMCDLEGFLSRSSCGLEHFTLHVDANAPDCLAYFEAMPALTFLSIEIDQDVATFVEVFNEDPILLPNLSTLIVWSVVDEDFDHLQLVNLLDALHSRSAPLTPLLSAEIVFPCWLPSESLFRGFSRLIAQGLKLRMTWSRDDVDHVWPKESPSDYTPVRGKSKTGYFAVPSVMSALIVNAWIPGRVAADASITHESDSAPCVEHTQP